LRRVVRRQWWFQGEIGRATGLNNLEAPRDRRYVILLQEAVGLLRSDGDEDLVILGKLGCMP